MKILSKLLPLLIIPVLLCACSSDGVPSVVVRSAEAYGLPGVTLPHKKVGGYVDCNSPAHWDGDTMYVFSSAGQPYRSSGSNLFNLSRPSKRTSYDNEKGYKGHRWIESTYKDASGVLYGWYHLEPKGVCPTSYHTAPKIGAVVSDDNGMNWRDLGIVLKAPDDSLNCETPNKYFAGGNGDFSVIIDRKKKYFYFLISTYNKDPAEQGVSVARMRYADKDNPVGKVWKWRAGGWSEPGLGGHVTPIVAIGTDWYRPEVDAFWGPSVHWNTYLKQYVVLLNRAVDTNWAQEGIYIMFNRDLAKPEGWSEPLKIIDAADLLGSKWYPQVIGIDSAQHETDKFAGKVARLIVTGKSKWELVFSRPGEADSQ